MTTTQPGFWAGLAARTHEVELDQSKGAIASRQDDAAKRLSTSLVFAIVVIVALLVALLLVLLLQWF